MVAFIGRMAKGEAFLTLGKWLRNIGRCRLVMVHTKELDTMREIVLVSGLLGSSDSQKCDDFLGIAVSKLLN